MTDLLFEIAEGIDQELSILARGPGMEHVEGGPGIAAIDPELRLPDPVELVGRCVALGFFPTTVPGDSPRFEVVSSIGAAATERQWQVQLHNLDASILRVLANILLARGLERLEMRVFAPAPPMPARRSLLADLPVAPGSSGFEVDYIEPQQALRSRLLRIELAEEPDDAALGSLYELLGTWIELMLLGGFPLARHHPSQSGVIPELAALIEPTVVEQTFDEGFFCHEHAFNVILHALVTWSARRAQVVRVVIR